MGAVGHGAWLVLVEPGHAALPVAPAMGAVAGCPRFSSSATMWLSSSSSWTSSLCARFLQRQLSFLVQVQYIDKLLMYSCYAVTGSLHGALLRSAWLNSEYMFCVSSWVPGRADLTLYVKGNSGPEVVSCPALRACLRVVLNGAVYTFDT